MSVIPYLQANPAALLVAALVLGLVVGSFLNVVIHRLPQMMERDWRRECAELLEVPGEPAAASEAPLNLLTPRSRCPHCGHRISALQNVPVLSYVLLRGRCAACSAPISPRYPAVELLGGLLAAAAVWHFGATPAAAGALMLTWALIALSFIDFDTTFLPDSITLPLLWLGLLFNLFGTFTDLRSALLGAMIGYGSLWLIYHLFRLITGKQGMGYGDFKLFAMLGAWLGWQALPAIILLASVVGAVVGVTLITVRGHDRNIPIPFGPYIAVAGWVAMLWGEELTRWYLHAGGFT